MLPLQNRGSAYCGKGDCDRAISDFDQATAVHSNRGNSTHVEQLWNKIHELRLNSVSSFS
jgi:hypothetical protein